MTQTRSHVPEHPRDSRRRARGPTGAYRGLVQRLGHFRWFAAAMRAVGARLDRRVYRASRGRLAITGPALFPVLLLTTTGRRTGRPRTTPVFYHRDGERLIVCSENFGQRRPAAWPLNLLAQPHATVQLGAVTGAYTARPAGPGEIDRYWPQLLGTWPAHATYHRRNGTRRMFVLAPADPRGEREIPGITLAGRQAAASDPTSGPTDKDPRPCPLPHPTASRVT